MDGMIRAHCMGTEFPKRDTDGPNVNWKLPVTFETLAYGCVLCGKVDDRSRRFGFCENSPNCRLPSAADLDAVAEEQRVKEKTSAQVPNR
jgi:hypothetical protein